MNTPQPTQRAGIRLNCLVCLWGKRAGTGEGSTEKGLGKTEISRVDLTTLLGEELKEKKESAVIQFHGGESHWLEESFSCP